MFRGDHPGLGRALHSGLAAARELGQPRAGSEHLLLGLSISASQVSAVLAGHGATTAAIGAAVREAAPLGAGAAADRDLLAPLGIDLAEILSGVSPVTLDRVAGREPVFPLGAAQARWRCARLSPPLGLDAQAAYAASLRLALARKEREHRAEHLALCLVALDPGVSWLLREHWRAQVSAAGRPGCRLPAAAARQAAHHRAPARPATPPQRPDPPLPAQHRAPGQQL